jgi:hypothetical protein
MQRLVGVVTAVLLIFGGQRLANALVMIGHLTGDNVGYASYWPEGLKEAVTSHPRVAGDMFDAPTFGSGMITINLHFAGNQQQFNDFLSRFSKVKHKELVLQLEPRKGIYGKNPSAPLKVKAHVDFDWQVTIHCDGLLGRGRGKFAAGPKTLIWVRYYLGDRAHLMGLDVPSNIKVKPNFNSKYRTEHKDDPTVQVIDTFVRLRQKEDKHSQK